MPHLPSTVAMTVADPKSASDSAIAMALSYGDSLRPEDVDMLTEVHASRGGDPEVSGVSRYYDVPDYN